MRGRSLDELMAEFKANEEEGKELAKKKEQPSEEIRKKVGGYVQEDKGVSS